MIDQEYDVVVVGMGPGGSAAARVCAEKGLKVLGVEKRQEIGCPKRCGEGLSKNALKRMGLRFDSKWVCQVIKGATVYAPNGKYIRIDYKGPEGWVIERKIFDKELAKQAARSGAKIIAKAEVIEIFREGKILKVRIVFQHEKFDVKTKILIASDGVESKIARLIGLDTTIKLIDVASAAQFEMANVKIDPNRIELYFGNEIAAGGYCWIFPKGKDSANVGIGVRKPFSKDIAYNYLKRFVESKPGLKRGSVIEVNSGGVPVGGLLENMVVDNFMVVGDAAHQVNAIHGGGISEAYVGGKIAGEVAVKSIKKGDYSKKVLEEYNKKWWDLRGKKLQKIVKLRQVVESLSDEELNWLAEYLSGEDLIGLTHASGFKKLYFVLMKKPRLIPLARKLL
jgi:digeranylgeranylglycerophospholipid reductase